MTETTLIGAVTMAMAHASKPMPPAQPNTEFTW